MGGEMGGKLVERLLDEDIVSNGRAARRKVLEPSGALAVVGKQAMDIGADHASIGGDRPFGAVPGEAGERPRTIRAFGHAHMHFVAGEGDMIAGRPCCRLETLLAR